MNCAGWHEKLALFSGGDLAANEAAAVEAHLAKCAECRVFEQGLTETREMLLSLRAVDETEVAAMRSRVFRQLRERKRPAMLAWLPYAAAIAALVFGTTLWRSRVERPVREARVVPAKAAVVDAPPVVAPAGRAIVRAKQVRRTRLKPAPALVPVEETEPTVVTLYTDDPDVVIVWITD